MKKLKLSDKMVAISTRAEGKVTCPWCNKGALTNTAPDYNDPPTVVYCTECSSVFKLVAMPELSP